MSVPTREEILALLNERPQPPCLSVFMCTDRIGAETQQNPIRLKNLLRQGEERLAAAGLRAPDVRDVLAPAYDLLSQSPFWRHLSDGLAVYAARNFFRTLTFPVNVDEQIIVNNRPYVKPLLPLLIGDGKFYVLALSQGGVRLYQGTRDSVNPIELQGVPANVDEAMHTDEAGGNLQFHTLAPSTGGPGSERAGMYFGNDMADNNAKRQIVQYFAQVDRGLRRTIEDEQVPLVLAGVEYLLPLYREANGYGHLLKADLQMGAELMDGQELHDRVWPLVEPIFTTERTKAIEMYRQLAGEASPKASDNVSEIVPAAYYGRVGTLLLAEGAQSWGRFNPADGSVSPAEPGSDGAEDLLDAAALYTLQNKGTVYTVKQPDMPASAPAAALFRY